MLEHVRSFFSDFGPFDWVVWLVGFIALAGIVLPYLVAACGGTIVRFRATQNPTLAEPDGTDSEYQQKYEELIALGFRPCGMVTERVWFFMYHLFKSSRVYKLVSDDGRTFASLYRLGRWGVVLRVAFASLTEDNVFVQTATPGVGQAEHDPDYHRTEVPEGSIAEVYARHLFELASVTGGVGQAGVTLDRLALADERRSARTLARIGLGGTQKYLTYGWALPFAGFLLGFGVLSDLSWAQRIGWSMIFAGLSYLVLVVKVIPVLLRLSEGLAFPAEENESPTGG